MKPRVPGKKEVLLAFLQRGVAMIHLDARRPGVSVPVQFRDEAHLRLNLSYRYGIPDLVIGDEQVRATLSFGGYPFYCIVPWEAVFGVTSHAGGDGQVWPHDLPVEVANAAADPDRNQARPPQRHPSLAAVESDSPPASEGSSKPPAKPNARHLRLVR
jgi:stringent starvation protein B